MAKFVEVKPVSRGTHTTNLDTYVSSTLVTGALTLPVYASNAAALTGGLTAGMLYKTAATGDSIVQIVSAT